jgi:outer membrane protein assembly factor BamB
VSLVGIIVGSVAAGLWAYRYLDGVLDRVARGDVGHLPDSYLVAVDARTGEQDWRVQTGDRGTCRTLAYRDERSVVVAGAKTLVSYDVGSGFEWWRRDLRDDEFAFALPRTKGGGPIVLGRPRSLVALDPLSGEEVWSRSRARYADVWGDARRLVVMDREQRTIDALDRRTGDVLWSSALPSANVTSVAVAKDAIAVVLDRAPRLVVLDAATGAERFRRDDGSYALVVDDVVVVATGLFARELHGVDARDGSERWVLADTEVERSATLSDHSFLGRADGALASVDSTTGNLRWRYPSPKDITTVTALSDRTVLLTPDPYHLTEVVALDGASGAVLWRQDVGGGASAAVTGLDVARGRALVTTGCDANAPR